MPRRIRYPLAAAVGALLACATAGTAAAGDAMPTAGSTLQPVGHYEFCQRAPGECRPGRAARGPVELTRQLWARMVEINNAVNISVQPRTDMELRGVEEYWSYPDLFGDCEDYVLEKRRRLIEAGVPAGNLLITVVLQRNGDGHAVLTITTDMGDYILDNMEPRIMAWSETEYRYLKRQSADNPARWVSVDDGRDPLVASVSSNR